MNAVERLNETLELSSSNRFHILYGTGIEDVFIGLDYCEMTIEQALLQTLNNKGFKRVAFIAPHKPVFYLDRYSEMSSSPKRLISEPNSNFLSGQMQSLSGGPLNNRFVYKNEQVDRSASGFAGMGDVHSIRMLDALLRETSPDKTAIVLLQAETLLRFFGDLRSISGIIGEWARLPANNPNAVIFVFSASRYDDLCQISMQLPIPELRNQILRRNQILNHSNGLAFIGAPDHLEILRMLRKKQQSQKLEVNQTEILKLSQWMAAEGLSNRNWMSRMEGITNLDLQTGRRNGWFSAQSHPETSAQDRIAELIGLDRIKQRIMELSAWLAYKQSNPDDKDTKTGPLLHMVFSGNPGTGKTTIARLLGELFHEIGLLKRGHLIEVHASDLVADFVGGTAIKTNQVIDQALDGVLFIDEAYTLSNPDRGGFGQEAIDTLLTRLEDESKRLVVIAAGYPDRMAKFIQSNPGLQRRFPKENFFEFPDYSPEELWLILEQMLRKQSVPFDEPLKNSLKKIIIGLHRNRDEQFGNAGEMLNLANSLERMRAVRIIQNHLALDVGLELSDLSEEYRSYLEWALPKMNSILAELDELVGLTTVKQAVTNLYFQLQYDQLRRFEEPDYQSTDPIQHMVFLGHPGTGKTTVARLIGQMYKALGILRKGHCIEVTRADLVAGYVGQTALKTQDVVRSALDGVLFIDEAYSLVSEDDFGKESVDFLVKATEIYRSRLVVITAGYPKEMKRFLASNPGLASRFGEPLIFLDYSLPELVEIMLRLIQKNGFILPIELIHDLSLSIHAVMIRKGESFGNARAIQQMFESLKSNLARRVIGLSQQKRFLSREEMVTFRKEDIPYGNFVILRRETGEADRPLSQNQTVEIENPVNSEPKVSGDQIGQK